MHFALRTRAAIIAAMAVCAVSAVVPMGMGAGVGDAEAFYDVFWNGGGINNGLRVVGSSHYLYGVGWDLATTVSGAADEVCVGAKTRYDGSGGNAIPFLCTSVPAGQTRWTPGGQSNTGYPTAIANADPDGFVFGAGVMNRR